jgi:hypothetical protein
VQLAEGDEPESNILQFGKQELNSTSTIHPLNDGQRRFADFLPHAQRTGRRH